MYMSSRTLHVERGRMDDAIALVTYIRDRLNSEHGGRFSVSVSVGGDPSAIAVTSPFEKLGDYERLRASYLGDATLQRAARWAASITTGMQDSIGQVIKPFGEGGMYAQVNMAMMYMPAVADAISFAVEVASFVDKKIGRSTGVIAAMTGNRARLWWIGTSDSLDQLGENTQKLETDSDYLAFFARSEKLFAPGTLEQSIFQILP